MQISRGGVLFIYTTPFFFLYSLTVLVQISRGGGGGGSFVAKNVAFVLPKKSRIRAPEKRSLVARNVAFVLPKSLS